MDSVTDIDLHADSLEATTGFAAHLGRSLRGGEVIELVSDVGGGKTTFVRGLASGMKSTDRVSSPSFTLRNEYRAGNLTMYHFDFYRLSEPGIMADELAEVINDPLAIVVVEWADIVEGVLPEAHVTILLSTPSETARDITINCPEQYHYLIKEMKV